MLKAKSFATTEGENLLSKPQKIRLCDSDDGSAYLQSNLKALAAKGRNGFFLYLTLDT